MEIWFILILSLCIASLLKTIFSLIFNTTNNNKRNLPPGPLTFPVIGNLLWLRKSFSDIETILRDVRPKYGPLITLRIGSTPAIFVGSHSLAHQALVQNGAVCSDRPKGLPTGKIINSNQHSISSASYGPTWRLLRRNLTSEILHPSRVKSYSHARKWVLNILIHRLPSQSESAVKVVDHFQFAMFSLLVLMCFGDKLNESQIIQIETAQRRLLLSGSRFNILNFWPRLGKIVFQKRWKELKQLRKNQEEVLMPLIKARINKQQQKTEDIVAYVDTLLNLKLQNEDERNLTDEELVTLCSEFLNGGTDTTSTALQWVMANLVKYPQIQAKLYQEIIGVVGPPPEGGKEDLSAAVNEDDLHKMPYLKAVVLESLRRHPPGHFVLPHSVSEDMELDGYVIPKSATVNFMVAEMGWDPKVWEDPMEFKPERFLSAEGTFDITGSREIKMMPFGAGRRICPGYLLALLHLEYFVANLIWNFEWKGVEGVEVDLSEKQEFTIVMKYPLRAHLSPRVGGGESSKTTPFVAP